MAGERVRAGAWAGALLISVGRGADPAFHTIVRLADPRYNRPQLFGVQPSTETESNHRACVRSQLLYKTPRNSYTRPMTSLV